MDSLTARQGQILHFIRQSIQEKGFSPSVREIGRHFRIGSATKIILGRNEIENLMLEGHVQTGYTCLRPRFAGPAALIAGDDTDGGRGVAVSLIVQHTKEGKLPAGTLEFWVNGATWTSDHGAASHASRETAVVTKL